MTVVSMMARYHEFGWAMKRLMGATNVRASSQREFAEKMTAQGYPIGQQLVSDYMRNKTEEVDGESVESPRAIPPMEFIAAAITMFDLTPAQREELVSAWLEILPEPRRRALWELLDTLRGSDAPSGAWREMLAFEQHRESQQEDRGSGERSAGGRAP